MQSFELRTGTAPLLVSFPHAGTEIPPPIEAQLTPIAAERADTDWHLPRLYEFVTGLGASTLVARLSRYVIDLNRPPEGTNLYPGQDTTGLVPLDTFHRQPLYPKGAEPGASEIASRLQRYWTPYHQALAAELKRLRDQHGYALLWDAHSIAPVLPRFFEGRLPDLNPGTAGGSSCAPVLQSAVQAVLAAQRDYAWVVDGRFKGGHITRHYGDPSGRIHAIQLEQSWASYMDEGAPFGYRDDLARKVQPVLQAILGAVLQTAARQWSK